MNDSQEQDPDSLVDDVAVVDAGYENDDGDDIAMV